MRCSLILVALSILIPLSAGVGCGGDAATVPLGNRPPDRPICVMKGVAQPPVKYGLVRRMKLGRQTFGGIRPLTAKMVQQARMEDADAIFNYRASQRFGFWPWRFIRPVVWGDAVQINNAEAFDCEKLGGELFW
jgi:hypothetical protein